MTFYQGLAVVLLRVWAFTIVAYFGYSLVSEGVGVIFYPGSPDVDSLRLMLLVALASYCLLGIVVWIWSTPLARHVARQTPPSVSVCADISADALVAIGSFLIGLYFLAEYGVKALASTAMLIVRAARPADAVRFGGRAAYSAIDWANLASHWAIVILAILLVFRAREIGRLFGWLRRTGQGAHLDRPEQQGSG